jgi:hypothetical protein
VENRSFGMYRENGIHLELFSITFRSKRWLAEL